MHIISFANPKGGSGKSTSALILGLEFSREASVAIIDADPNAVIQEWAETRRENGKNIPITIVSRPTEKEMIKTIEELGTTHDFVLVDLEGTANRMLTRAFARSSLVIIPLNASSLDARRAGKAVELVEEEEEAFGRPIPFRLLWSRFPAVIQTRSFKKIHADMLDVGYKPFQTGLVERAAYRDLFDTGETLEEMIAATNKILSGEGIKKEVRINAEKELIRLEKAQENAYHLALEVIQTLKNIPGNKV